MEETGDSSEIVCCMRGFEDIPINHEGIRCSKGHQICPSCSPSYIESIFKHPLIDIPAKGSDKTGRAEIDYDDVVRYMDDKKEDEYNIIASYNDVPSNEKLVRGGKGGGYIQQWRDDYKSHLFYCQKPKGSVGTCLVCLSEFKYPKDVKNLTSEESKMVGRKDWYKTHEIEGGKYVNVIKIREIIENGNQRVCPNCGYCGRKDSCCTHMTCERCNKKYCYIGGKLDKYLDKEDKNGSIYSHNVKWQTNEKRCPMNLSDINTVDNNWPKYDEDGQEYLHTMITKNDLRNYAYKIGKEKFLSILKKFPDIEDNSFDLSDLFEADLTLIKRKKG